MGTIGFSPASKVGSYGEPAWAFCEQAQGKRNGLCPRGIVRFANIAGAGNGLFSRGGSWAGEVKLRLFSASQHRENEAGSARAKSFALRISAVEEMGFLPRREMGLCGEPAAVLSEQA